MFVCDKCKKAAEPGIQPVMVPTGLKKIKYPTRQYKYHGQTINDPGGEGLGFKGEHKLCPECAVRSKYGKASK